MNNNRASSAESAAFPTTTDMLTGRAFIEVFSTAEPNLAGLIGSSRAAAYAAVARGEFPCHRPAGCRRVRIPVPALQKVLLAGDDS